ncbi:phosphatase PAP2 family protein [Rhizobium sp. SSA_523]|uniref:phosphatase PAP2 family protein n=1 Tax=Rhizobium sp. SSA_523 TaxID=2952477 RepID=UPI00209138F7|nr:phosphatase PAP2 family protein [Rhizobium sp. SSA_523]MCO5731569.1 phosphatase PAP2 family protein [Rhizobium sp. SSA_523]WKC21916.1 phosphatase PAP2 family protein [Rhizobium sp. SSA_523]
MSVTDLNQDQNAISKTEGRKADDLLPQALILVGLISLVFAAVPELDLIVTRLFYDPATGFSFEKSRFLILFRDTNRVLPWAVIGIVLVFLIPTRLRDLLRYPLPPHKLLFVLTYFALGPGLSVHLIKMLVGRARPRTVDEFGGTALFTPPWQITDECMRNCSFISGEAASAFALLTLVLLVRRDHARVYLATVGIVAAAFSFNRVVFGAHFLSDVVMAWSLMFVLAVLLWRPFSRHACQIDAFFGSRSLSVRARSSGAEVGGKTGVERACATRSYPS